MVRRISALLLLVVFVCMGASGNAGETGHAHDKRGHDTPRQPPPATETEEDDPYELQRVLVDTLDQVQRNYVKGISRRELVEAAIEGILRKLDPYSAYIGPDQLEQFRRSVENEFGGIGVRIGMDDGRLKVISPLVGTPAYRAGVLSGDRIIQIDGRGTAGISLDEAVRRLKGKVGSTVTLTVIHPGAGRGKKEKTEEITVTREQIRVETVLGDLRKDGDAWDFMLEREKRIGYVRVTGFSHNTAKELRAALEALRKEKLRALILDLRFNPGGLLRSAIEVSDMFVSKGRIVSTTGRNSPERTWDAHDKDTFDDFSMVVLVNRYTASAGEIVAACLQDHRRAVIMGERTWGKGSVQNVISLEHGRSRLKLTTAQYFRPSGKNIHRFPDAKDADPWGVRPDKGYELRLDIVEMLALVNRRRGRDIVHAMEPKEAASKEVADNSDARDEPPEPPAVDRLLNMAVEYLTAKLTEKK